MAADRPLPRALRLAALALLLAPACAGSTGNERLPFAASVGGVEAAAAGQPYTFTNDFGYQVTLTAAKATLGPVYLNTIRPLREARSPFSWLIGSAWAADEHLGTGRVVGQVLGQVTVDLLSPSLVRFAEPGVVTRDEVRTAEIFFYPPPGLPPETVKMPTAAVELEGTAEQAGESIHFRGRLTLDDTWLPRASPGDRDFTPIQTIREVRGIPSTFTPEEGGRLEIRIDPAALVKSANFSQISANPRAVDDPSVVLLVQDSSKGTDQVMKAIYNSLHASLGTYAVRWVSPLSASITHDLAPRLRGGEGPKKPRSKEPLHASSRVPRSIALSDRRPAVPRRLRR